MQYIKQYINNERGGAGIYIILVSILFAVFSLGLYSIDKRDVQFTRDYMYNTAKVCCTQAANQIDIIEAAQGNYINSLAAAQDAFLFYLKDMLFLDDQLRPTENSRKFTNDKIIIDSFEIYNIGEQEPITGHIFKKPGVAVTFHFQYSTKIYKITNNMSITAIGQYNERIK